MSLETPHTRIQYYDNLRAFACCLVILTHAAMPALSPSYGIFMVFFSVIASPSSELFISISSSLLVPTKLSMKEFYVKRFSRLLWPFMFWSFLMLGYRYVNGSITKEQALNKALLFPIQPTEGVYWFVYVICSLYILIPILSPWLKNIKKKELQFVILIWFITLCLPYLNIITGQSVYKINGNYYFILNYMGGFIGYLFLGVYFKKFPIVIESRKKLFLFLFVLLSLGTVPILWAYLKDRDALEVLYNNLSLTSAFYVSCIYIFFRNVRFPRVVEQCTIVIAKYSFGIYLIHFFVVRELIWKLLEQHRLPHPLLETPFILILTLVFSLLIVRFISFFPYSKYIIGS